MNKAKLGSLLCGLVFFKGAWAHQEALNPIAPDSHAPIGVMGDHMHKEGEWMVSYRVMQMSMRGNLRGSEAISADEIVTQVSNPNAPPPTVRVVPVDMTTTMHMLGLMYAPTDKLTLMVMLNHVRKTMDHTTYMGMMGTNRLGGFETETSGIGDTKIAALWGLMDRDQHKMHLNLGLSLPTGSIDEEDDVLTPMNTQPTLRLPYAMQLGTGTYAVEPGLTYYGNSAPYGWGTQIKASIQLGENDEDYTFGNKITWTNWGSYRVNEWSSVSLRLTYVDESSIDGMDEQVRAPVTTANPDNYGGERIDLGVGVNLVGQRGGIRGHRVALEYQSTVHQDGNGVQMEMQSMFTLGYQYAF